MHVVSEQTELLSHDTYSVLCIPMSRDEGLSPFISVHVSNAHVVAQVFERHGNVCSTTDRSFNVHERASSSALSRELQHLMADISLGLRAERAV